MAAAACNVTRIANASDSEFTLALFGVTLDKNETYDIPGNVYAYLTAKYPGIGGIRAINTFNALVDNGYLAVIDSPDATCGQTYDESSSAYV